MEIQQPVGKIHVAIGADLHEGFATLEWTLKKWSSDSVIIVILYADNSISRDYVITPIGRIPTSSLSDEKLKVLEMCEEAKTEKILSQYMAFCKKVKVEVVRIGRHDDPLPKVLVDMITNLGITKLVMAFSFIKLSSWRSKKAVRASFYIYRQKPEYCELFVICEGRLVLLREENDEGFLEDDQGVKVAKLRERRMSFRGLLGKMFYENGSRNNLADSSSSSLARKDQWGKCDAEVVHYYNQLFSFTADARSSSYPPPPPSQAKDQWGNCKKEIEQYFNQLLSSIAAEGDPESPNGTLVIDLPELQIREDMENTGAKRTDEGLKIKIREMEEAIQSSKKEAMVNAERSEKAKWAISLYTRQAVELEGCINQENAKRIRLKKELKTTKEVIFELQSEVEEKRTKLNFILEIQQQLSNKLQLSSTAKARVEIRLEKSIRNRDELIQEIKNLRRQRDVLQCRIEFCKEKDAIEMANEMGGFSFDYMEFTAGEIGAATDSFSEQLRLKSAGHSANAYKGRINQTTVAIKLLESDDTLSQEAFYNKVKLLNSIRHPHILGIMGFCIEPMCIVYEYMHNGCLSDALLSNPKNMEVRNQRLSWHARIRIASEVCIALSFLHKEKPWQLTLGNLNPSKILLDQNNVAKIYGLNPSQSKDECDIRSDIRAFGNLLLQLLTAGNMAELAEEAIMKDGAMFTESLDKMTGEWPLELAKEVGEIAKFCLSSDEIMNREFNSTLLMRRIDKIKQKADELVASGDLAEADKGDISTRVSGNVPSMFLCPIYQNVMKNPYIAADGYSYEHEAIEKWLQTGHDTSPMTNLKLKNKSLTPNHTLCSMIQDWQNKSIHNKTQYQINCALLSPGR